MATADTGTVDQQLIEKIAKNIVINAKTKEVCKNIHTQRMLKHTHTHTGSNSGHFLGGKASCVLFHASFWMTAVSVGGGETKPPPTDHGC